MTKASMHGVQGTRACCPPTMRVLTMCKVVSVVMAMGVVGGIVIGP
jgi:hypothetical protein